MSDNIKTNEELSLNNEEGQNITDSPSETPSEQSSQITADNIEDSEVIRIYAQGEENHLLFAQFLFNKYKNKSRELEGIVK